MHASQSGRVLFQVDRRGGCILGSKPVQPQAVMYRATAKTNVIFLFTIASLF